MAKSDLLKEAIADARAVKETALANAKIALQEAFAPKLERMLKDKLQMEVEGDEMEADIAAEPEMDAEMDASMDPGAEVEGGDDFNWVDNDLSAEVGGNTYDFEVDMAGDEDEELAAGTEEMPAEEPMGEPAADEYGDMEEDLNLEQIIRELEDSMPADETMMDDNEMGVAVEGKYSMPDDNELSEEDDYNIDEIIESILREEDDMADEPAEPEMDMAAEKEEELAEAYRTVQHLKNILSEVNLLNAKLLYTNKLFRNFELSETQKMKVIENFDRAGNTREVKLVFSTLAESFNRPTKKRVVKESYASKPTATTAPRKETTQVLSEGFELANRWKKLAGLL
jgi:hypothetical protein